MRNHEYEYDQYEVESETPDEYDIGFNARAVGEPFQADASADWQRGWDAAADSAGDDE
jgi:hypothetical protein